MSLKKKYLDVPRHFFLSDIQKSVTIYKHSRRALSIGRFPHTLQNWKCSLQSGSLPRVSVLGPTPARTRTEHLGYRQHSHSPAGFCVQTLVPAAGSWCSITFKWRVVPKKRWSFQHKQTMLGKHKLGKSHANSIPGRVVSPLSAAGRASTGSTGEVQKRNKKVNRK